MPARLKDIANDLGLSVVTISKVLRNHPDIGEATRKRVLKRRRRRGLRLKHVQRRRPRHKQKPRRGQKRKLG